MYRVPPPWAQINWKHPIARGLTIAMRVDNQAAYFGDGPVRLARVGSGVVCGYGFGYPGAEGFVAGASYIRNLLAPAANPGQLSFFALATASGIVASEFPSLLARANTGNTLKWLPYVRHTTLPFRLETGYSGGARAWEHPNAVVQGTPTTFAISHDRSSSSNVPRMMLAGRIADGSVITSNTGTPDDLSNTNWTIGGNGAGNAPWKGAVHVLLGWERTLLDAELRALHDDPYLLWRPDSESGGLLGPFVLETTFETFVNVTRSGASASWQNTGNAKLSDDSRANTHFPGGTPVGTWTSDHLVAKDTTYKVPAGSIITGIEIIREGQGDVSDSQVRLVKAGTIQSNDKSGGAWTGSDVDRSHGGPSDKWSDPTLSLDDVNSAEFGAALSVSGDEGGGG